MRLFESEPALREANDALLHFARSHSIVNHWGTGFEASSDLMSLDASRHLYDAPVDPKRRVHGVGAYQTVLDQWGIPYDHPVNPMSGSVGVIAKHAGVAATSGSRAAQVVERWRVLHRRGWG